ncbi:hypothetical protein [Haladaptatus sp. NG-WS-4]
MAIQNTARDGTRFAGTPSNVMAIGVSSVKRLGEKLGRNPDVHHIVPVRWFIKSDDHTLTDAHFLDNVISLCSSCHRKAEYGTISRDELLTLIGAE